MVDSASFGTSCIKNQKIETRGSSQMTDHDRPTIKLVVENVEKQVRMIVRKANLNCNLSFRSLKLYDLMKSQTKQNQPSKDNEL